MAGPPWACHPTIVFVLSRPLARERIQAVLRVGPDITFGVPVGLLFTSNEPLELRKITNPATIPKEPEAQRGTPSLEEELLPFLEHALGGNAIGRECATHGQGFGRGVQLKAGDELHPPEHAKRVFAELLRCVPKDPCSKVLNAMKRIEDLPTFRLECHGIHRKVSAGRGIAQTHAGIGEVLHAPWSLLCG